MSETALSMRPRLLITAPTYPRWPGDPEPAFVHELARRLIDRFEVTVLCPHAKGAAPEEILDGVRVVRYRYAPEHFEVLVNDGGIVTNLRHSPWKWLLVRSEEHTSELQSLMRISYAVFCLKKKNFKTKY